MPANVYDPALVLAMPVAAGQLHSHDLKSESHSPLQSHYLHQNIIPTFMLIPQAPIPQPSKLKYDRHLAEQQPPQSKSDHHQVMPVKRQQRCQRSQDGKRTACLYCRSKKKACKPLLGGMFQTCR